MYYKKICSILVVAALMMTAASVTSCKDDECACCERLEYFSGLVFSFRFSDFSFYFLKTENFFCCNFKKVVFLSLTWCFFLLNLVGHLSYSFDYLNYIIFQT